MDESYRTKNNGKLLYKATIAVLAFIVVVLLFFLIKLLLFYNEVPPREYGMFTSKPTLDVTNTGRIGNDLKNVAIILKCTSEAESERWLTDIKKQRKNANDLPIYIYSENATIYQAVKKFAKTFDNVKVVRSSNGTIPLSDVLKSSQIEYVIEADDTNFIGADFADYYFLGQKVMKLDKNVECVCGGSFYQSSEFFQPSQGDIIWLMDYEPCDIGAMRHRDSFENASLDESHAFVCLRPEVSRVSNKKEFVTKMSFNVAKMDPNLLTVEKVSKRMNFDLKNARTMQKLDWDDLKRQDEHIIYKFPFAGDHELSHYFDTMELAEKGVGGRWWVVDSTTQPFNCVDLKERLVEMNRIIPRRRILSASHYFINKP